MITKWIERIVEYYKDKALSEKCGLKVSDICVHQSDGLLYLTCPPQKRCDKCGAYYYD